MADKTEQKPVEASFVFIDSLGNPIPQLDVVLKSASFEHVVVTDMAGLAWKSCDVKRNETIAMSVKRRDGKLVHKFDVTPKRDVNVYTFKSPEFHLTGTTKISPEEALELTPLPEIRVGEVMKIGRLLDELGPFIDAVQQMEDIGKVLKDVPIKKKIPQVDPVTGKPVKPLIEIEHAFKVVKTDKPVVQALSVLGEKLSYPKGLILTIRALDTIADEFGCEMAALKAVADTESAGEPFFPNGLPKILYERHYFYKFTNLNEGAKKGTKRKPHPFAAFADICQPTGGGYGHHSTQYSKLVKACRLDRDAALKSCSWGAFQVMGAFWEDMGYKNVDELVNECMESADGQLQLFRRYLKMNPSALAALKAKNWEQFTSSYNGSMWKEHNPTYPTKMANNYAKAKK
jgi:hypothetical protein